MLHVILEFVCCTVVRHAGHAIDVKRIAPSRKVGAGLVDETCDYEGLVSEGMIGWGTWRGKTRVLEC